MMRDSPTITSISVGKNDLTNHKDFLIYDLFILKVKIKTKIYIDIPSIFEA